MEISNLPLELLIEILLKTDGRTLGICRRVSKHWKEIIDSSELMWHAFSKKDFPNSSNIARRKSGRDISWSHIYRNMKTWHKIANINKEMKEFYKFNQHDKCHALEIDNGILPLIDTRGIVLYDMHTLKNVPVVVPEKNCLKISHNNCTSAILIKSGLLIQRTVTNPDHMSEAFFKADNFVLSDNAIYFFNNREVFKCDLIYQNLASKLVLHCDYDIKVMQYNNNALYLFTDCGKIVTLENDVIKTVKHVNIPEDWFKQVKHMVVIDDKNFVCYSRILFKIETSTYQHLYLDFPVVTAIFFYGDIVVIGTQCGEILLYRLSSQKKATKPIFEDLAWLPSGKYPLHLDVCERKSGPVLVVATFFEIYIYEFDFFPNDSLDPKKKTFTDNRQSIYKRLLRLKDRLQCQTL